MALVPAVALGTVGAAVSYQVATGKPKPRAIDNTEAARRPAYWRNWVGNSAYDVREDSYRADSLEELQTSFPRQLPDGSWLPPDNGSNVNPAVGAICRHPGWPRQNFLNMQIAVQQSTKNPKSQRAPMPPRQQSLPTV